MSILVAISGIDGAGKSTLVKFLQEKDDLKNAIFVHKTRSVNVNNVLEQWLPYSRDKKLILDYSQGSFAKWLSLATSFDFLQHYQVEILPYINSDRIIICDRYIMCYVSYMLSTGHDISVKELFEPLKKPDISIYIDVSVETAIQRQKQRGEAMAEEGPEVLKRFKNSYLDYLESYSGRYHIVSNEGRFTDTCETLVEIIKSI